MLEQLQKYAKLAHVVRPVDRLREEIFFARGRKGTSKRHSHIQIAWVAHHFQSRLTLRKLPEDLRSAVGGTIIDENNFPIVDCAVEKIDCSSQKGFDEEFLVIGPRAERDAAIELAERNMFWQRCVRPATGLHRSGFELWHHLRAMIRGNETAGTAMTPNRSAAGARTRSTRKIWSTATICHSSPRWSSVRPSFRISTSRDRFERLNITFQPIIRRGKIRRIQ